jgi:hypothetical protein
MTDASALCQACDETSSYREQINAIAIIANPSDTEKII